MAELKRLNEDYLIGEIQMAALRARDLVDTRAEDLIKEVRQAVAALPLDLSSLDGIPGVACFVKHITVKEDVTQLFQVEMRFSHNVQDQEDGYGIGYLNLTRNHQTQLKRGDYQVVLIIQKRS